MLDAAKFQRAKEHNLCFNCMKFGHRARDCPEAKRVAAVDVHGRVNTPVVSCGGLAESKAVVA